MRAVADDEFDAERALMAHYSIDGQLIGSATRVIKVSEGVAEDDMTGIVNGFDFSMPPGVPVPDLTIAIVKGNTVDHGTLVWHLLTPRTDIDVTLPAKESQYKSSIGNEPREWARNFMNAVNANPGGKSLDPLMVGSGKTISEQIPVWVRRKLLELWQQSKNSKKRPTVLIVSDEPYIPWELAYLKLDANGATEGFLGAEFVVGRWVLGYEEVNGSFVPAYPPPIEVTVKSMAVVTGDYTQTKSWNKLEGAEQEAKDLIASYHATKVNADSQLATWLQDDPGVDLIHFAVHGNWSMTGNKDGVVLVDGTTLTPTDVRAADFKNEPFIFLNACQLGQGDEMLGDYGGIAAAFLKAGAGGVIASLWNVDDKEAGKLAVDFYKKVIEKNQCAG